MQSFSRQQIQKHFNHAAPSYDDAAILQKTVAERIDERLELTTIEPQTILDLGAGTGLLTEQIIKRYPQSQLFAVDLSTSMLQIAQPRFKGLRWPNLPKKLNGFIKNCKLTRTLATKQAAIAINADVNQLPFADNSVDLIVSNLMLQWCDDLDQVFAEFRRVLRPEGLIMFTTFGPDTLKELKQAWQSVDATYEHVNNFIDMHDIGDALIRNGFGQPVMDMEVFTLTYEKPMGVLKDLKAIGATNANKQRNTGLMGKQRFAAMLNAYEELRNPNDNKIPATYEVVHGHAWAAQEIIKGPNRDKSGHIEISLDEFSKQLKS
ncbi:malonyl-ACP O-methyltransferase BioC [Thiomicrorhabdus sp. Milos-T2]|uniref:malonyl-ACP O-methyltransferase BioC n=1 Tax=Thiomicrorhabdus sp. Milos-T2 TaxID=90814 RepID=UPI0004947769|nr:malonyl-ACP O-methyltransferase BioC [Thiomicrorhabdus sp. Milos-T2]